MYKDWEETPGFSSYDKTDIEQTYGLLGNNIPYFEVTQGGQDDGSK